MYPGGVAAVDGLDLSIADGEFFALLGPSGCGKTTLLRTIAGLEYATWARYGSASATSPGCRRQARRGDGLPGLRPVPAHDRDRQHRLPAADPEDAPGGAPGEGRRDRRGTRPGRADGTPAGPALRGQQQRVALARAIAYRPPVFLFDEPLSNLDARLRLEARTFLKRLQRELGVTTVFVTHDQAEALALADRIAVMEAGRIRQIGTPREVFDRPANMFVANFIGSTPMNLLPARVVGAAISGIPGRGAPGAGRPAPAGAHDGGRAA